MILDPNDNSAPIDDFVLLVTDWWKEPAEEFEENMNNSMITRDQVGQFMSDVKFHSFLANGRGWEDSQQLLTSRILSLPLENLAAQCSDKPVRLRLINVGFVFSFQLRVAGHKLR